MRRSVSADPEAALDLVERALSYRRDSVELRVRHGDLKIRVLKKRIAKAREFPRPDHERETRNQGDADHPLPSGAPKDTQMPEREAAGIG